MLRAVRARCVTGAMIVAGESGRKDAVTPFSGGRGKRRRSLGYSLQSEENKIIQKYTQQETFYVEKLTLSTCKPKKDTHALKSEPAFT